MTTRYLSGILTAAGITITAAGCISSKTITGVAPHKITVVDAATKRPVAGAEATLSGPEVTMGERTNKRGVIEIGSYGFYSMPKPEQIEITRQGYNPVSFRLTNGLPHTIEITPVQGPN